MSILSKEKCVHSKENKKDSKVKTYIVSQLHKTGACALRVLWEFYQLPRASSWQWTKWADKGRARGSSYPSQPTKLKRNVPKNSILTLNRIAQTKGSFLWFEIQKCRCKNNFWILICFSNNFELHKTSIFPHNVEFKSFD